MGIGSSARSTSALCNCRNSIVLALAGLALAAAAPAPIDEARPALWVIHDADTTIYLFGTFHTLDARTNWLSPQLRLAFDRSSELVLETVVPKSPAEMKAAASRATLRPDGRPAAYFESNRTVMNQGRQIGLSTDRGADQVLRRLADEDGKPVAGLERFEEQLAELARIKTSPVSASAPAEPSVAVTLNDLLAAWKSGDSAAFASMLAGFKAKAPDAYRILIANRNQRWAGWIAERLERPGVVFVAVGSGHLAGEDSVQARLAVRGIASRRIG